MYSLIGFMVAIVKGAVAFVAVQLLFVVLFIASYKESISGQLKDTSALLPEEVLMTTTTEEYTRENSDLRPRITYARKRRRPIRSDEINAPKRPTVPQTFDTIHGCTITNEETLSAINRATTPSCKNLIYETACAIRSGQFYPTALPHSCPNDGHVYGKYLGCYQDDAKNRILRGERSKFAEENFQKKCIDRCVMLGFPYAGIQFGIECFCGDALPSNETRISESSCKMKCPANETENCRDRPALNIFETGIGKIVYQPKNTDASHTNTSNPPVRIAFFMMINGRDLRQVIRLFKALYHRDHYYFIHVDKRQEYMFRGLVGAERIYPNVRLARTRHSPVWGSASLLTTLLEGMAEMLHNQWNFDFMINLSESDFPLQNIRETILPAGQWHSEEPKPRKVFPSAPIMQNTYVSHRFSSTPTSSLPSLSRTTEKLEAFLWANRGRNFIGSGGCSVFNTALKQGVLKTFVECDDHMWLVGDREFPTGIAYEAGSDWFVFSRAFVHYIVTAKNDTLLNGLKLLHQYTIMSPESFFQIFARNSAFCVTRVNENLRHINWNRLYGCQCQQRYTVDWCGCSPNVFLAADWSNLQVIINHHLAYLGRKFDPTISQSIINNVEEKLYDRNLGENGRRYWHNIYHHLETSSVDKTVISFCSSLSRRAVQTFAEDNSSASDFVFSKVLQVFSYHEDDLQKGILVNFEATNSKNISIQLEAWYNNRNSFTIYDVNFSSRLIVGTDFDFKERIFRNRLGIMGPFSQPVLMYQVTRGTAFSEVGVIWLDPTQTIAQTSTIASISPFPEEHHSESNLTSPLTPGVWEVFLVHKSSVFARITFLVVPLSNGYNTGTTKSLSKKYELPSLKFMPPVVKLLNDDYNPMAKTEEMLRNESYVGAEREKCIDDLTKSMYPLVKLCYVPLRNKNAHEEYYKLHLPSCRTSDWSSFSPDPKGQFSTVNEQTGRLNF